MPTAGPCTYKKKPGELSVDENAGVIKWSGDGPAVTVQVSDVQNLQATPSSSPKMMLRVICHPRDGQPTVQHVFSFSSRPVMDALKDAIHNSIASRKAASEDGKRRAAAVSPQPQSQPQAQPQPATDESDLETALSDKQLLQSHELQQQLLLKDKELYRVFQETVIGPPNGDPAATITGEEFWATRIHLLRAYAVANYQQKGRFNVLSTIKPVATSDNQVNVSVSREKIHSIFALYPVVRTAYDENVPKLSETEFWARFFNSKLFRKLRGEKIGPNAKTDIILDTYLNYDENFQYLGPRASKSGKHDVFVHPQTQHHVTKIIDVEGNCEDNPEPHGNRPDITMQEGKNREMVDVLRTMNKLSEKVVYGWGPGSGSKSVAYSGDADPEAQETREAEELVLSDLEEEQPPQYSRLALAESDRVFGPAAGAAAESERLLKRLKVAQFYDNTCDYFRSPLGTPEKPRVDLQNVFADERKPYIARAAREIVDAVRVGAKDARQCWRPAQDTSNGTGSATASATGITGSEAGPVDDAAAARDIHMSDEVYRQLHLCHSTSVEFLRHFWSRFGSGDVAQVASVRRLAVSLEKCRERVAAAVASIPEDAIVNPTAHRRHGHPAVTLRSVAQGTMQPLVVALEAALAAYRAAGDEAGEAERDQRGKSTEVAEASESTGRSGSVQTAQSVG